MRREDKHDVIHCA